MKLEGVCSVPADMETVMGNGWTDHRAHELDVFMDLMTETFNAKCGALTRRSVNYGRWILVPGHWMLVPEYGGKPEHEQWVPEAWNLLISMEAR